MNANKIRTNLAFVVVAALAASAATAANERGADREQKQDQRVERQVAPHDYRREQRVAYNQPAQNQGGHQAPPAASPPPQAPPSVSQPPRQGPPAGAPSAGGQRRAWNGNASNGGNYNGRYAGGNFSGGDHRVVSPPHSPPGHQPPAHHPGGGYSPGHGHPPHIVPSLPYGYNRHYWNGNPYYYHSGHWYRPYGSSYIVVGAPYGLFVSSLPYYSSFWYGTNRYFYSDGTYYNYEPARHGYVVTQSPYVSDSGDSGESGDVYNDDELYVYPAQGQSEQQQADDRYECHRWAVDQTQYDPTDSDYDAQRRSEYTRAITACLTGRGYTVR